MIYTTYLYPRWCLLTAEEASSWARGLPEGVLEAQPVHFRRELGALDRDLAQIPHAHQIIGRTSEAEHPVHLENSTMPYFSQQRDRIQPTETFSDALPLDLAHAIAYMLGAAMLLRRRRSHQILSTTSENRPTRDVAHTETPIDHANLDLALDIALRAAVQGTGASSVAIALMCGGQLVCRARAGDIAPDLGVALNVGMGITGACVRTAQVLHCHDTETDARVDSSVCRALGIRSILVVPIVVNGAVAGILETLSSNDNAFNSEHIEWLTRVADFVHALARGTIAPSCSQRAHPDAEAQSSRITPRHGLLEPVSFSGGLEASQDPRASAEDPGLAALLGSLQNSSPTATWDEICEQLASRFR